MKNTHTPGRWNVYRISRWHDDTPQDFDFLAVDSECGTRMSLQQGATGKFAANARLIASAPDMFDALQAVCDAYGDRDTLLMAQCKAALAKAKGEA
jgi:hypothetical protein